MNGAMIDVSLHQPMDPDVLARRWKEAREAKGLGANELDRQIGQTSGFTSRVEAGKKPGITLDLVARAAAVLGVSVDWLAGNVTPHEPVLQSLRIERVVAIAANLGRSAAEAQDVAASLAAFTGAITDEEIAARFTRAKPGKAIANTVITDVGTDDPLDDLRGGRANMKSKRRKR